MASRPELLLVERVGRGGRGGKQEGGGRSLPAEDQAAHGGAEVRARPSRGGKWRKRRKVRQSHSSETEAEAGHRVQGLRGGAQSEVEQS